VNSTADVYRMNPAEDTLVYGDQLAEGMWVLPSSPTTRFLGEDEDSRLRAQRFCRVTRLRREPFRFDGEVSEVTVFVGEWVDGYQYQRRHALTTPWLAKKAPADPEATEAAEVIARVCLNGYNEHVRLHGPDGDKAVGSGTGDRATFTVEREGRLYDVTVTPRERPTP
jgi:hypothetical protein